MKKPASKTPNKIETAFEQVQKFYQFMNANKLEVVEFSKDGAYIRLVRKHDRTAHPIPVFASPPAHAPQGGPARPGQAGEAAAIPADQCIKAPMSGIFYRAPTPSSPPYVREGDSVRAGQVICVIEAMKVFNEIKADEDCIIEKVLVENGKPVEPNQNMFLLGKIK